MGFRRRGPPADVETTAKNVTNTKGAVGGNTAKGNTKSTGKGGNKNSNFIKLGAIVEKKDGSVYLKLDEESGAEITVNGRSLKSFQIEDPTVKFDRMVEAGKLTPEEADEKANNVPAYILFEVTALVNDA